MHNKKNESPKPTLRVKLQQLRSKQAELLALVEQRTNVDTNIRELSITNHRIEVLIQRQHKYWGTYEAVIRTTTIKTTRP